MTSEYAIEILEQRKCCRECVADCTCDECDEAFDMAIKALSAESKWISIDDRLPEEYESVMVTVIEEIRGIKQNIIYPEARYSQNYGWEWAYEAGADYWESIGGIVAWQPLPEPYKAESEEEE